MQQIAVIDYGMGNLRSVSKALEFVAPDANVVVTHDVNVIANADKVVCPGQGAAADCMEALKQHELIDSLADCVASRPFLGICMGLQVLFSHSEENSGVDCCDLVDGLVKKFDKPLLDNSGRRLKVPHMGWSKVQQTAEHPVWHGIDNEDYFYFAHSYYCEPRQAQLVSASCHYGHEFAVAIQQNAMFACQFHPEKSAGSGLQLLKNFSVWSGRL